MIDTATVSLNYIKKEPFFGSDTGMRYRLTKTEDGLLAVIWPEPFNFINTDESVKISRTFEMTVEGKDQAVQWMNDMRQEKSDIFDAVYGKSLLDFINK